MEEIINILRSVLIISGVITWIIFLSSLIVRKSLDYFEFLFTIVLFTVFIVSLVSYAIEKDKVLKCIYYFMPLGFILNYLLIRILIKIFEFISSAFKKY